MKLSDYCKINFKISNRVFKKYLKEEKILLNHKIITKNKEIFPEDNIKLNIETPDLSYNLQDYLIKETESIVFLYKPPFMHSERHKPDDSLTIEDIIKKDFPDKQLITRLDYETDGLIAAVNSGYKIEKIKKIYLAKINGIFNENKTINNKIDAKNNKKVKVLNESSANKTYIKPYKIFSKQSIVKVEIEKATRHQIRAYLSYLNFPIIGDSLYGNNENCRLQLHCLSNEINEITCNSSKEETFLKECPKII
jgi:23S rRNA-/tRNA-specific pseudouridylate synthase